MWDGDHQIGIPSMDLESLQMMLYVEMSGAPVSIKKSANPAESPNGKLPAFICNQRVYSDFQSMTEFLRMKNYGCDQHLSARQCADVLAYTQLFCEKLYPALLYLWWMNSKNYDEVIGPWYFSKMSYPWKLWVPKKMMQRNVDYLDSFFGNLENETQIETQVLKYAQEGLTLLSHKLGESEYFFGRNPSTIDALLIGYLTLLYKVDLKTEVLKNHIRGCPNLARYTDHNIRKYFSQGEEKSKSTAAAVVSPFPLKRYLTCSAAVLAANGLYLYTAFFR